MGLAPRVGISAVAPGVVKTKMGDSLLKMLGLSEEEFAKRYTLLEKRTWQRWCGCW